MSNRLSMPLIEIRTEIKAPISVCFELSRSVDLHIISTNKTGEQAIAGRTSGLMTLNETVTWKAKHLYVWQTLSSRITEFNYPTFFADEMVKGAFKSFRHEHKFEDCGTHTVMIDRFDYTSPLGRLGRLADTLFLKRYMNALLAERNRVIKEYAESGKWRAVLA